MSCYVSLNEQITRTAGLYYKEVAMLKSFAIYDRSSKHLMVTFFKKRPYFSRLRISGMAFLAFKDLKTLVLESILK